LAVVQIRWPLSELHHSYFCYLLVPHPNLYCIKAPDFFQGFRYGSVFVVHQVEEDWCFAQQKRVLHIIYLIWIQTSSSYKLTTCWKCPYWFSDTNNCLRQTILKPGITCTSSKHTSGSSINLHFYIYFLFFSTSFSLKLLFKLFFITEYAFSLSPLFSYALVAQFCITEYAEIVPTVNKVNAEQYKMKLTR